MRCLTDSTLRQKIKCAYYQYSISENEIRVLYIKIRRNICLLDKITDIESGELIVEWKNVESPSESASDSESTDI
jgi:hypothetical protein